LKIINNKHNSKWASGEYNTTAHKFRISIYSYNCISHSLENMEKPHLQKIPQRNPKYVIQQAIHIEIDKKK
jgi:hypothetical protein